MQAETGDALIEASRHGDRAAFARIIERYQRAVYAVAYSGVRDRALADDVTQDAFVVAWRQLDELRDSTRLPAWLCGIARNLARDARKRTQRETPADLDHVAHTTTPFDELSDAESEQIVAAALGQVPDVYREPLVLYYYEEHSIDDVARSLGISTATTNKRLSRGRRYLAERVALVERGVLRRGPSPGLVASVLAIVGIAGSASHVDASPAAVKGSTMHKLALAAVVTASVGGAGFVVVTAARGDAHAKSSAAPQPSARTGAAPARDAAASARASEPAPRSSHCMPSLAALVGGGSPSASEPAANDCAAVGRYLAELQADATHGPATRPDDASSEECAAQYTAQCESEGWSAERRSCTLAAADLINAHLCAGAVPTADPPASIPPALTCALLGAQIAATAQGAGLHPDVTDMPQQIEAACEMGAWSLELRQCFAAASTLDALKACFAPALEQAHE